MARDERHLAGSRSERRRTTQDAFAWLSERLPDLGITRLADITGLDRIGIPVVQAIRPLGLANTVTQGKGPDLPSAGISAIMEAAEQVFSERLDSFDLVKASASRLGLDSSSYAMHLHEHAPSDWIVLETAWLAGANLITSQPMWVPFELVHSAYVHPPIPTDRLFFASTTGLACAFDFESAVLHGLLECIERDAIARAHVTHGFFHRFRLDEATIQDASLLDLIERVQAAGCTAAFWQAPAAGSAAVVWCQIMETSRTDVILPFPADGFAAGFDVVAAAASALREAAQSRLAAISGARDEVIQVAHHERGDWIASHRRLLESGPRPLVFGERAHARDPAAAVRDLLAVMERNDGITSALAVRLESAPCAEIIAVRVVVPQLTPFA